MPDKIDVARLADEAMRSANAAIVSMPIDANFDYVWHEHFARLVMEEAREACREKARQYSEASCVEAYQAAIDCSGAILERMP
jgi:hypothetical protein